MDVSGKTALVTGGGSGIGLEFVKLLHSKGCNVMIGDLSLKDGAKEVLEAARASNGPRILYQKTDVTIWKELEALFAFTESELGVADIVCPSAGLFEPLFSNFWEDTEDQSYKTVQVNIEHPTKATRLGIRALLGAHKPGVILIVSSTAAQSTRLSLPIYCASKAYTSHFVRNFELLGEREDIRVMAVAPGLVATPLWFEHNKEKLKAIGSDMAWIQPVEIAEIMLEMIESNTYKGGQVVEACGRNKNRLVEMFNDTGPPGAGQGRGSNLAMEQDTLKIIAKEKSESV